MKQNNFLQRCIGISMIAATLFFGAGFLIRSVQTANANPPSPQEFIDEGTNSIGKYNMAMVIDAGQVDLMVWNTQTGKSTYYYYSNGWKKSAGLPENPVDN